MEFHGICGLAFNGINSYLENRKQFVYFDKCNSGMRNISCGVPQSSILGPNLFIIYIYILLMMSNTSNLINVIVFADDTNIFHANSNISGLNGTVCCVLEKQMHMVCNK